MRGDRGGLWWWRLAEVAFWLACVTALLATILTWFVPGTQVVVFWLFVSCYICMAIALSYRGGLRVWVALGAAGGILALGQWLGWSPVWGMLSMALALLYALLCYVQGNSGMWPGD
jgi:hypothetical protein